MMNNRSTNAHSFCAKTKLAAIAVLVFAVCGTASHACRQNSHVTTDAASSTMAAPRDGAHDFDFNIGVWHTHINRIADPLSGSGASTEFNGTVTVRKIWGGRAQLERSRPIDSDGHQRGLTLFLYNPQSHQWLDVYGQQVGDVECAQPLARSRMGAASSSIRTHLIGSQSWFAECGRRSNRILIATDSSWPADGGESWHPAFIANLTREEQVAA